MTSRSDGGSLTSSPRRHPPDIFWLRELTKAPEPPEQLIGDGFLDVETRLLIAGKAKVGKSFVAIWLAGCLAGGQAFLGWQVPQPRRVAYIQMEVGRQRMRMRVWDFMLGFDMDVVGNNMVVWTDREFGLRYLPQLRDFLEEHRVEIVIVDPLYLLHMAKENAADEMTEVVKQVDTLAPPAKAVVVVHHFGKSATAGPRGSSILDAWPDSLLYLEGKPARLKVTVNLRNGPGRDPFLIGLVDDPKRFLLLDDDGHLEQILPLLPAKQAALVTHLGEPKTTVNRWLHALEDKGLLVLEKGTWASAL